MKRNRTDLSSRGDTSRAVSLVSNVRLVVAAGLVASVSLLSSVARADAPLPEAVNPHDSPVAFKLGVQGGLGYWTEGSLAGTGTNTGVAHGLANGYTFGLRASLELTDWFAIDARGMLFYNQGTPDALGGHMTTVGGLGALRFTLPVDYIRPYALVGFGVFHHGASGGTLLSGTEPAPLIGLGALVPVGKGWDVGAEYTYIHLLSESLSTNPDIEGGDPSSLSFFVQYRLAP